MGDQSDVGGVEGGVKIQGEKTTSKPICPGLLILLPNDALK